MKVEYVNPFIKASMEVINQTTGLQPQLGKIYERTIPYKSDGVIVLIGLVGEFYGSTVISLNKDMACKIASAMMGGFPIETLDEMAKSAVSELCNMILGNVATIFSKNNINVDITPPTVLTGENIQLSVKNSAIICIPLIFDDELYIELDIAIDENNKRND